MRQVVIITGGDAGRGLIADTVTRFGRIDTLVNNAGMSAKGKLARWLKLMAPGLVDKLALAALKQDVRPH